MSVAAATLVEALSGRYSIERELGRGGMATVYFARDLRHGRPVALKVIHPELTAVLGPARFLREISTTARLQHPLIPPLFDSGESNGHLWYVMPYADGESLRHRLAREKQLPLDLATRIARDVLGALAYAHECGVVHRDIKPENILLERGVAVLSDFGIAQAVGVVGNERLTETGLVLGTPAYMSPEQAAGERTLDGRSDLYSMGCVLYEMLAGEPPFTGPSAQAVLARQALDPAPPLRTVRKAVPPHVEAAVHKALEKVPADRFATAADFAEALIASSAAPVPTATGLKDGTGARALPGAPRYGRQPVRLVLAALGFAAVLGAVFGGLLLRGRAVRVGAVPSPSRSIAVLPMATVTSDTGLERLGRELTVTLSATLGRVADFGVIDPQAVLAAVGGAPARSRGEAADLALRLGAGRALHGTLVRIGRDSVRLETDLLELPGRRPIVHAAASAPLGDLVALTDSITLGIVRGLWTGGDVPAPSLAGIATGSVEALRHYLHGERAFARADFPAAVAAFERAFALDTTFYIAYWRSLYPRVYEGTTAADREKVQAVLAHRAELPVADRRFVEAITAESLSARLAAGRALTRAHPSYWPGWYQYANSLLHDGPYLGSEYDEARVGFEQVVGLQPRFAPAWMHLFWIALYQRDTAAAARALDQVRALYQPASPNTRAVVLRYEEVLLALLRGGGDDPALIAGEADYLAATPPPVSRETLGNSLLEFGFDRAQIALADALLAKSPSRELATELLLGRARAWASRGAWDSALVSARRGARLAGTASAAMAAYAVAAVGSALGALDADSAGAVGREVNGAPAGAPADRAERYWLDGVVALARGDAVALERARAALAELRYEHGELLERSLAGLALAARGDTAGAGRALARLEEGKAEQYGYEAYAPAHTWLTGLNRLLGGRFLLVAGERDRARRLLTWHEAVRWGATNREEWVNRTLEPLARLERAGIEEAAGLELRAAQHYAAFLDRFDSPVPALLTLRREAEAGLARVSQDAGSLQVGGPGRP